MYSQTYQAPTVPQRIVQNPNLHFGRQHTTSFENILRPFQQAQRNLCTYNESCRGDTDFRIQRLLHSTVQDHHHTRKEAVQKLIHQFETHPKKRCKPTWSKITRSIHSASSRRKWSTAWETWSTSRFAKSLPKYSAATVWRTGRKALKTVLAGRACDPQKKNSKTKQGSLWCFVDSKRRHEGPYHGARHGNTEEQRNHHAAHVSNKKGKEKWLQIHIG